MFGDRDTWFSHELKHHRSLYVCKHCESPYTAAKLLEQHIINEHRQYSYEETQSLIEHGKLVPSQLKAEDCPFCDDWASILSQRRQRTDGKTSSDIEERDTLVSLTHFKRHVATHQEQLAIFALPRTVDDEEERGLGAGDSHSEASSSKDRDSQIADRGAHDTAQGSISYESPPTCVHLSGLPPNVRSIDIKRHFGLTDETANITFSGEFGLIQFFNPNDAQRFVRDFNGDTSFGVRVEVRFAKFKRDPKTGETRVDEDLADKFDHVPTIDNQSSILAKVVFSRDQTVAFSPKPPTPKDTTEWYLGTVKQVLGEGKGRRYIVKEEDPDVPSPARKEYKMSTSGMIPIPPPGMELPRLDWGKTVLALYPDSSIFYKADVMGMDYGTPNVILRFKVDEDAGVQQIVERRFVVDYPE